MILDELYYGVYGSILEYDDYIYISHIEADTKKHLVDFIESIRDMDNVIFKKINEEYEEIFLSAGYLLIEVEYYKDNKINMYSRPAVMENIPGFKRFYKTELQL